MKKSILLAACLLFMPFMQSFCNMAVKDDISDEKTINVISTPEFSTIAGQWAFGFSAANADYKVNVLPAPGDINWSDGQSALFIIGNAEATDAGDHIGWKMSVGREVIVPVISSHNPAIGELSVKGLSPSAIASVFTSSEALTWGSLLGSPQKIKAHGYISKDITVTRLLSAFIKSDQGRITAVTAEGLQEILKALEKDPGGIAFCRLTDIIDYQNNELYSEIRLMPVDLNGNGKLDYFEKIYSDLNEFEHGVWIGKYPKELYNNIFAASAADPSDEATMAFIGWILKEGQKTLPDNGFATLESGEILSKTIALADLKKVNITGSENIIRFYPALWIIGIITMVILIAWLLYRLVRPAVYVAPLFESVHRKVFNENNLVFPKGLFLDRSHSWAFMEKDGYVRVGMDDFLQHVTGKITRIMMKNKGDKVRKGDVLFTLSQNGKQLRIYSPVTGTITGINEALSSDLSVVNTSPYSDGWIYMVEPEDWLKETRLLMMGESGAAWIRNEVIRLKDFLAGLLSRQGEEYSNVVLQDGGEIREYLLEDFGPEAWEEFQTSFIDKGR